MVEEMSPDNWNIVWLAKSDKNLFCVVVCLQCKHWKGQRLKWDSSDMPFCLFTFGNEFTLARFHVYAYDVSRARGRIYALQNSWHHALDSIPDTMLSMPLAINASPFGVGPDPPHRQNAPSGHQCLSWDSVFSLDSSKWHASDISWCSQRPQCLIFEEKAGILWPWLDVITWRFVTTSGIWPIVNRDLVLLKRSCLWM